MSILSGAAALVREVTEMLHALRGLAREMRAPAGPQPHPFDASPLPSPQEAAKGAEEEARGWAELDRQLSEWLKSPPESGAAPVAPSDVSPPSGIAQGGDPDPVHSPTP